MLNGTKTVDFFTLASSLEASKQGAFPESCVRHVYYPPPGLGKYHSKYVIPRKGLKGSIKLDTSELAYFCRAIPLSLWVGSLIAVAWGGMLCQLGND